MIYLLDANALSDMVTAQPQVMLHVATSLANGNTLGLCRPIHYEIRRGLYWRNAVAKLRAFNEEVMPLLTWVELTDADWDQAAHYWADTHRQGRQLSDPDLLLAALAYRTSGVVISSDTDFDALPITREDWRIPASQ
jgi:predicted nucleic acid-binding protein